MRRHHGSWAGTGIVRASGVAAALAVGLWAMAGQPPTDQPAVTPADAAAPVQPESKPDPKSNVPAEPSQPEEREAIVILRDGQRYSGILVSRDEQAVVLRIGGIETKLKMSSVDRVQVLPPVAERYRQMRAAISDTDVDALLRLVRWLQARSQWDSALKELGQALTVQPDNPDALALKRLIESQRDLANKSGEGRKPTQPKKHAGNQAGFPLLTDRDINLIKVYEVDLTDPPRMIVDRDTITAMMEQHAGDPLIPTTPEGREAMYRASPAKLLDIMFRIQARNLYERVRVLDQPKSMKLFRERVHRTWLDNSCATSRCHGGSEAGRLQLATDKPGSDVTVYTNFIILERTKTSTGKPLINYEAPADSPLLQVAMARDRSTFKHPVVPGEQGKGDLWRPVFKSADDARFLDAIEWIKAMYKPRPDYPVKYTLPGPEGVPKDANPPVVR